MAMNPFGIASLPADVMSALRVLPQMAERLDQIAAHTEHLQTIRTAIEGVEGDTRALTKIEDSTAHLPEVEEALHSVASDTSALSTLDSRMASIEEAMPVLVEVQQHLAGMPEAINGLQSGIDRLCVLMEGLLTSVARLDGDIESLQQSIAPVARVADRLPGGGRRQS